MHRYKSILVSLHNDDRDDALIDAAERVARMAQSGRVRFVHVVPELSPYEEHPGTGSHERMVAQQAALEARVRARFAGPWHTAVHCEVTDGPPLPELLRLAQEEAFDLLLVSKTSGSRPAAGGGLAERLARKAPCSVLAVPPGVSGRLERVLVAVDFSAHAADAADVALAFAEAAGLDRIHFLHAYVAPTGYSALRRRALDLRAEAHRRAEQRFRAFLDRLPLRGLTPETHLVETTNVPDALLTQSRAIGADLLVLGTRGRSPSAAILLGTVAEQVLRRASVPVVAVKRKGATMRLLDLLLEQHVAHA